MVALFDFLKRKKEAEKALRPKTQGKIEKPAEKKSEKASVAKETKLQKGVISEDKLVLSPDMRVNKKTKGFSYKVIKEPHISEKATDLANENKYTFKVYENSNKLEIKKSVEGIYGVNVLAVKIIKIPHKKRRLGKTEGFKKAFIKAIVTVKEGQKIEIL